MTLLIKINQLIGRAQTYRQICEVRLVQVERQRQEISAEISALQVQQNTLRQLLALERPLGQLDRAGLFVRQRRQAVLRRQYHELELQSKKLNQQYLELGERLATIRAEQRQWRRKQDKYQIVVKREKRQLMLTRLRQEETEMQEIITCRQ